MKEDSWTIKKIGNKITGCSRPLPIFFSRLIVELVLNSVNPNHSAGPGWYAVLYRDYNTRVELVLLKAKTYKEAMPEAELLAWEWCQTLSRSFEF